jgi:hypothetical protein
MVGKRTLQPPKNHGDEVWRTGDLESGQHKTRRFGGFKDAVEYAMDRQITASLKEQLRSGVDREEFEKCRKSDEEVERFCPPTTKSIC